MCVCVCVCVCLSIIACVHLTSPNCLHLLAKRGTATGGGACWLWPSFRPAWGGTVAIVTADFLVPTVRVRVHLCGTARVRPCDRRPRTHMREEEMDGKDEKEWMIKKKNDDKKKKLQDLQYSTPVFLHVPIMFRDYSLYHFKHTSYGKWLKKHSSFSPSK